tara:strand:+ start:2284 stop:3363 length:1080 start_codon:yes stop_codon:yes gene_type:complete
MKLPQWLALSAFLSAGLILWSLREILIQIFAGIVIAMALCTITEQLNTRIPGNRSISLAISLMGIIMLFGIILIIVVPPFTEEFQQLITQLPKAASALLDIAVLNLDRINEIIYGEGLKVSIGQQVFLSGFDPFPDSATLATGVGDGIKRILGFAGNLGSGALHLLFVLSVSIMVAIQPNSYREVSILLLPSFYRKRARSILKECGDALTSWMVGVLISSFCVAILAGIGLSFLGVKLVIANALLAGILNVIPNVGPVISTIFPMSVALLDEPWKALAVLGMYIFIQNLESYLITPSVMHHQVKLLPGLTLTAQFIFTIVFGPIGLILAIPLAVVLQVLIKQIIIHDLLDQWKSKRLAK